MQLTLDTKWIKTWYSWMSIENSDCNVNFGNGYFGTTAVFIAGTNASNNGIFEYDV